MARNGTPLYSDLSFALESGQRLIILGPSGAGKTTLVRALAGLWSGGSGSVALGEPALFLPQEPYIPEGSLRRVLSFPLHLKDEELLPLGHWEARKYIVFNATTIDYI